MDMQRFKDFNPSDWDSKDNYIAWGDDTYLQEWYVAGIKTRDAKILEESNYEMTLQESGGESDNVEVQGFGHSVCGHYDLILVKPDTNQAKILERILETLENYPVLDESNYSEREYLQTIENISFDLPNEINEGLDSTEVSNAVYGWLCDNDYELESMDDSGAFPKTESIDEACRALGYMSEQENIEANEAKELAEFRRMYPDDCPCGPCRDRRKEESLELAGI